MRKLAEILIVVSVVLTAAVMVIAASVPLELKWRLVSAVLVVTNAAVILLSHWAITIMQGSSDIHGQQSR